MAMETKKHPCMIISGGSSRRFGEDKGRALLGGKPLIEHVLARLSGQVGAVAINSNDDAYEDLNVTVLADAIEGGLGPLAGVLTAMEWAQGMGENRVLTCAVDTPFLPADWAECLAYVPSDMIAVSFSGERVHNVCAIWPTALAQDLRAALEGGQRRVGEWIEGRRFAHVPFDVRGDFDPFFNINTPEDMTKAEWIYERLAARH